MLSPAHSWLLIVGLTSLLLVIYVLAEQAIERRLKRDDESDWTSHDTDFDQDI